MGRPEGFQPRQEFLLFSQLLQHFLEQLIRRRSQVGQLVGQRVFQRFQSRAMTAPRGAELCPIVVQQGLIRCKLVGGFEGFAGFLPAFGFMI